MKRTTVDDLHKKWMKNPRYRREYNALEEEFSLSAALIEARSQAGRRLARIARPIRPARRRCMSDSSARMRYFRTTSGGSPATTIWLTNALAIFANQQKVFIAAFLPRPGFPCESTGKPDALRHKRDQR